MFTVSPLPSSPKQNTSASGWEAQLEAFLNHPYSQVNSIAEDGDESHGTALEISKPHPQGRLTSTIVCEDDVGPISRTSDDPVPLHQNHSLLKGPPCETACSIESQLSLLEENDHHRMVVLLVGPSGSGKTSFVSRISSQGEGPYRVSLSQGELLSTPYLCGHIPDIYLSQAQHPSRCSTTFRIMYATLSSTLQASTMLIQRR